MVTMLMSGHYALDLKVAMETEMYSKRYTSKHHNIMFLLYSFTVNNENIWTLHRWCQTIEQLGNNVCAKYTTNTSA